MFTLIFIINLIIIALTARIAEKSYNYDGKAISIGIMATFMEVALAIVLIVLIFLFPYNVEKKIFMYEEENAKIELKIKETVRAYMDYEKETYKSLVETADLTTLLIKYPELKSNELVKEEIKIYTSNNVKIKELKERQIDRGIIAFCLYFGN